MMGELQAAMEDFFSAFERGDVEALVAGISDDAEGVDEVSRRWLRGREEMSNYIRQLVTMATGVKTAVSDGHESIDGDRGLLTCWMEQDYTFEGTAQHISAPTTVVFRRVGDDWK